MNRRVSPIAATVVILIAAAGIGAFFYVRANLHPKPIKPGVLVQDPKFREALAKRFKEVYGSGQH